MADQWREGVRCRRRQSIEMIFQSYSSFFSRLLKFDHETAELIQKTFFCFCCCWCCSRLPPISSFDTVWATNGTFEKFLNSLKHVKILRKMVWFDFIEILHCNQMVAMYNRIKRTTIVNYEYWLENCLGSWIAHNVYKLGHCWLGCAESTHRTA